MCNTKADNALEDVVSQGETDDKILNKYAKLIGDQNKILTKISLSSDAKEL